MNASRQLLLSANLLVAASTLGLIAGSARAQCDGPQLLLDPSGAPNDELGISVSISGDTAVVGAQLDDGPAGVEQGSVSVFRWNGASWVFEAKLIAADGGAIDLFGYPVDISGDTIVAGARLDDGPAGFDQGSAYVFVRAGTTWTQQAKLTASDASTSDSFGISVAISGDTVIVGAHRDAVPMFNQGSAYVFVRSGSTWTEQAKLTASDGADRDEFGVSVEIAGDTALVGAWYDDGSAGPDQGSAYVFVRAGSVWTEQAKLTASDAGAGDNFGQRVVISDETVVVGAAYDDGPAGADQGSASVFVRSGSTWTEQTKLTAADGSAGDLFGIDVAISGETTVVGAVYNDGPAGIDQGAAYVFVRSGSTWNPQAKLTAPDAASGDNLGVRLAVWGDTAIVAAYLDDGPAGVNQGSATVFQRFGSLWRQGDSDVDGNGQVGLGDLAAIILCWAQPVACNPHADADATGTIDLGDIAAVITYWGATCP